jgi:hypothetical protein
MPLEGGVCIPGYIHPLHIGVGLDVRKRKGRQCAMLSRYERIDRKAEFLEHLDSKHGVELVGTFTNHLADAIRTSSPRERDQQIAEATKAYEDALDEALYELLDKHFTEEDSSVA